VLVAPAPNAAQLEVILCLPTAPGLPIGKKRRLRHVAVFFFGSASDKLLLAYVYQDGMPEVNNKDSFKR
jgi:hypothetical protein